MSDTPAHPQDDASEPEADLTHADPVETVDSITAPAAYSLESAEAIAQEAVSPHADEFHGTVPEYPPAAPPVSMPAWKMTGEIGPSIRAVSNYGFAEPETDYSRIVRVGIVALGVLGVLLFVGILYLLRSVLIPFAAAFLLAYLIHPLVRMFNDLTGRRGVAVGLTVVVLAVFGVGLATQVVPVMARQTMDMTVRLSNVWQDIQSSIQIVKLDRNAIPPGGAVSIGKTDIGWREFVGAWSEYLSSDREAKKEQKFAKLRDRLHGTILGGIFENNVLFIANRPFNDMLNRSGKVFFSNGWAALAFVSAVIAFVGLVLVISSYLVLLIKDFPSVANAWRSLLPPSMRGTASELIDEYSAAMSQHFARQAVASAIIAVLFCVGFTMISLPMAIPLGVTIGLLSMVPFLKLAGIAPALTLAAFTSVEQLQPITPLIIKVIALFVIIQLISELILKPFLVKRSPGGERMGILLGMFVLPAILGWLGVLLAIPATCLVIAWTRVQTRRNAIEEEYHQLAAA